jgi:hypothetical protein
MYDILEHLEALDKWDEAVKAAVLDPDLHPPQKKLSGFVLSGGWCGSNSTWMDSTNTTSSTYAMYFDTNSGCYIYKYK